MMDLKMEVYSPALELLGVLEKFQSILWEDKAFSAGSFSVEAPITAETTALLVPENILWIEGETAGIIEYIQESVGKDGLSITVKGYLLTGILDRRILWGLYNLKGTVPSIMTQLVNDCAVKPTRGDTEARKIPGLVLLDVPTGGETITMQQTGGTLLEVLEELAEAYHVAFGVRFNAAIPRMEFWTRPGVIRSVDQNVNNPVFYSTELEDVLSSEYSYNSQDYRNVALVAGEGEGSARAYVTVENQAEPVPTPPEPSVPDTPTPPTPVTKYSITLAVDPAGGGTVTGAGTYQEGAAVTVTASPADDYQFAGWQENGVVVSEEATYPFIVDGNRTLTAVFEAVPSSRLPLGYTEVEYVQTDSKCGINTGRSPVLAKTRIVMDINAESYLSGSECIFSAPTSNSRVFYLYRNSAAGILGRFIAASNATVKTIAQNIANSKLIIDCNLQDGTLCIGDSEYAIITGTVAMTSAIYLFGSASTSVSVRAKLYSAQMYEGDTQTRDFVPCINPDGIVGLYDLVEGVFYQNAWTGTLTAGPAV